MVDVTHEKIEETRDLKSVEQLMLDALQTIKKRLHEDSSTTQFNDETEIINDWKVHSNKLISENKQLQNDLENSKRSLLAKIKEIDELKKYSEDLKHKYHPLLDKEHDFVGLKKQLNDEQEKNNELESRISTLKQLLSGQKESIQVHKNEILKRDKLVTIANEQLVVLAEEKKISNLANEELLTKINQMKRIIDKLNDDLMLRENEIKNIRSLLIVEKNNEKERLKQKLIVIAKAGTKKEVLMEARLRELMDVVAKQKDVINEFATTDTELVASFKKIIEETQHKRAAIDYSIVKKEFEEITVDNASISKLVEEMGASSGVDTTDNTTDASTEMSALIRSGLQNGDPPEMIKKSLISSGNDETEVTKALEEEAAKLNVKL